MQKKFRFVLLAYALYHICAIVLMPNPTSLLSREFAGFFLPYTNLLGFNTTWQFYSPEPASYLFYSYEVQVPDGETVSGRWPPAKSDVPHMFQENYNRIMYNSRYVTSSAERVEKFFVPFLCRKAPGALTVSISTTLEELPPLEKARLDSDAVDSMKNRMREIERDYPCQN